MTEQEISMSLTPDELLMVDLIKKLLKIDPSERMTCEEALKH